MNSFINFFFSQFSELIKSFASEFFKKKSLNQSLRANEQNTELKIYHFGKG